MKRNLAGTSDKIWHKSDTAGSGLVHDPDMKKPGALAGATGTNVKADQLQERQYTDTPNDARRVDQNGNWNRGRWGWLKAITADADLSPMARLLAHVLATQFSHHETAHCAPGTYTLAAALATSADTIKRALRDLAAAGWLIRTEGRGRGNRSEIFFLGGTNIVPMIYPKGPEASGHDRPKPAQTPTKWHKNWRAYPPFCNREQAAQKGADMRGKGGKYAPSYIKADSKDIQRVGRPSGTPVSHQKSGRPDYSAYDRATAPEKWEGALFTIKCGGGAEEAWNSWLTTHGYPTLSEIAPKSGNDGWYLPCTLPPRPDGDRFAINLAEKWARIFSRKVKAVPHA